MDRVWGYKKGLTGIILVAFLATLVGLGLAKPVCAAAAPTVTSVTPSQASVVSGDTVVITGANFVATPTVLFGSYPSPSVTYIDSSTLSVTVPAGAGGPVPIYVRNPDTFLGKSPTTFNYIENAPSISSVTPSSGTSSGLADISISGSGFLPSNSTSNTWTVSSKTFPMNLGYSNPAIIGDKMYMFGGWNGTEQAAIFTAPVSDPTNWTNTGRVLPGKVRYAQLVVINDMIYIFGGFDTSNSVNTIFSASISDPLTWTNTGKTLPVGLAYSSSAVVDGYIYLFGGLIGSTWTNAIYRAPVTDPTNWTTTGKTLPSVIGSSSVVVIGDTVYLYGGYQGSETNVIYTAPRSDPTTWTNTGKTLPTILGISHLAILGNKMYLIGGWNGAASAAIYEADISDPTAWTVNPKTLPAGLSSSSLFIIDNAMYLIGGQMTSAYTNVIYSSPIDTPQPNSFNKSWMTTLPTISGSFAKSSLKIDTTDMPSATFNSQTTITTKTPAHNVSSTSVTVTNYDGQSTTKSNAYTYSNPVAYSITPTHGPASGGQTVSVAGDNFVSKNSTTGTWVNANKTLLSPLASAAMTVVGDYIYAFGGRAATAGALNTIWRAPVSDPTSWINTGHTIPAALGETFATVIGDKIYLYGGWNGSVRVNTIYSASVSDPYTWTDTGKVLPGVLSGAQFFNVNGTLYLIGGYNTTVATNTIYTASASDPTTWTNASKTFPTTIAHAMGIQINGKLYIYGGTNGTAYMNSIYVADASDPTTWTKSLQTMPSLIGVAQMITIGDTMYILGGYNNSAYTNTIYTASLSNPLVWTLSSKTLPAATGYNQAIVINNAAYLIGGWITAPVNTIFTLPITHTSPNIYDPSWKTNWQTTEDKTGITIGSVRLTNNATTGTSLMSATTAAATPGTYDVTVSNWDGSSTVIPNGYTYDSPPSLSSILPSATTTTGGDLITIYGSHFDNTSTVLIDNLPVTTTFINSTTLQFTSPAHANVPAKVAVENGDGQTDFVANGLTYLNPSPLVTSITPAVGPQSGGTNVTINGLNFIPKNTTTNNWSSTGKTLPGVIGLSQAVTIGNYVYMFGGRINSANNVTNIIWRAPVSDPTSWVNTGKTLPIGIAHTSVAVINDKIYLFGGFNGTVYLNNIYSAPISDPTSWSDTGKTLPSILGLSQLAVIGDTVYMFGGWTTTAINNIYSAPISDPTNWSDTGKKLPTALSHSSIAEVNGSLYLLGGHNGSVYINTIFTATTANPTVWTNTGKTLPTALVAAQAEVVGDSVYLFGGFNGSNYVNTIFTATTAAPTVWTNTGKTLPVAIGWQQMMAIDNKIYLFGGYNTSGSPQNVIYSADVAHYRNNVGNESWTTNWGTVESIDDTSDIQIGGLSVTNINFVNDTTITATTAAHDPGVTDTTVKNFDGQSNTLASSYEYMKSPTITGFTPSSETSSGGDTIIISGTEFLPGATVDFGGVAGTNVVTISRNAISVTAPAHSAGNTTVTVTNTDGQVVKLSGFIYVAAPPSISSVTPGQGPKDGGTSVTISGLNISTGYSRDVVVPNAGTSALSNYHALISFDSASLIAAGKMKSDGGDIRIYDTDGSSLTYWVQAGINTTNTQLWVKIPYLPAGGKTLSLQYGKPDLANQSSATLGNEVEVSTSSYLRINFPGNSQDVSRYYTPGSTKKATAFYYSQATEGCCDTFYVYADNVLVYSAKGSSSGWVNLTTPASTIRTRMTTDGSVSGGFGGDVTKVRVSDGGSAITLGTEQYVGATVSIDGLPATQISTTSTSITVLTAAHPAGLVDVTVTNTDGQSYTLPSSFNYREPPTVTSVSPNSGVMAGGDTIVVSGYNFRSDSVIKVGPTVVASIYINPYLMTYTAPAHSSGATKITVMNSDYQFSSGIYNYLANKPTISGITPSSGTTKGGTKVTISGADFSVGYARPVVIPNTGTSDLINYVGTFVIDTSSLISAGKMRADAGDLRVLDSDGTNLEYYISDGINTTSTRVFVKIPRVNPGGKTIKITYGAPTQTSENSASFGSEVQLNVDSTLYMAFPGNSIDRYSSVWAPKLPAGKKITSFYYSQATEGCCDTFYVYADGVAVYSGKGTSSGWRTLTTPASNLQVRITTDGSVSGGFGGQVTLARVGNPDTLTVGAEQAIMPTVTIDGNPVTLTSATATSIVGTTPAHAFGVVDVSVTNTDGSKVTLPKSYTYTIAKLAYLTQPLILREMQSGTITIQAQDEAGQPLVVNTDVEIPLSTSSSSGFFARDISTIIDGTWDYNSVIIPAGNSTATFYYKDNLKGSPVITAGKAGGIVATVGTQTETITSRYQFVVSGVTNPVKSGIPSSITIQAVDYLGQPLHDYTGTVHFTSTDSAAAIPQDFTITPAMLGGYTFTNGVTMVTQGDNWCVTATDANNSSISGSQCGISVSAPSAGTIARLSIITPQNTFPATAQSNIITVQAQDSTGSPVPVSGDTFVYLYIDTTTGLFSLNNTTWATSGVIATIKKGTTSTSFYYKDTSLGTHTITVRDDKGTGQDFGIVNATQSATIAAGNAYKFVTKADQTVVAGKHSQVRIAAQDALGDSVIAPYDQQVYVTSSSPTAILSSDGTAATSQIIYTIPAGSTGITIDYYDRTAGARTITASDTYPADGDTGLIDGTVSLNIIADAPDHTAFISQPQQVIVGAQSNAFTLQLRDQYENQATAINPTTYSLAAASNGATFQTSNGTAMTTKTIDKGKSTTDFYLKQSLYTNPQTITATSGSMTISQAVTILPGAPSRFMITSAAHTNVVAGSVVSPIRVELQNQYGVQVPADSDTVVYLKTSSIAGSFSLDGTSWNVTSATIPAGSNGIDLYYRDTKAGTSTLTIADEASGADVGIVNASQNMTIVADAMTQVRITSAQQSLLAGQVSAPVTVQLEDAYDNPVNAKTATAINFGSTSSTIRFDTTTNGTFSSNTKTITIPAGQSGAIVYFNDPVAETPQISVTGASVVSGLQDETISWGDVVRLGISGPNTAGPNEVSNVMTVGAYNQYNIQVPVQTALTVALTSSHSAGKFALTTDGPFDGTVGSVQIPVGSSSASFFYTDSISGPATLTAAATNLTSGTFTYCITSGVPTRLLVTTTPQSLSTGQLSSLITLTLADDYNNPATAADVTSIALTTTSVGGNFQTTAKKTTTTLSIPKGSSTVSFYYVDTSVGNATLTASADSLVSATQIETISYGNPAAVSLSPSSSSVDVNHASGVITAAIYNAYGQVIPVTADTIISLTSSAKTGKFDLTGTGDFTATSVKIPAGSTSASFYYLDTQSGVVTLSGASSGITTGSFTLNLAPAQPVTIKFINAPITTTAGNVSGALTIGLYDQYGNLSPAQSTVMLTTASDEATSKLASSTSGPWTSNSIKTVIATGQQMATIYYKDTVARTETISAAATDFTTGSQTTTIVPAAFNHLTFSSDEQSIVARNNSKPIQIIGYDQYNNPRSIEYTVNRWHYDNYDNYVYGPVQTPLTIGLTSNHSGATFSTNSTSWSPITSVTLPYDSTGATLYYRDPVIGSAVITGQDTALTYSAFSKNYTITAGVITSVAFTSQRQSIVKDTASQPIEISLKDANGYTNSSDQPVDVSVSTSGTFGEFSTDGTNWSHSLSLHYAVGDTSHTFYYRSSSDSTDLLTASTTSGLSGDSQLIAVIIGQVSQIAIIGDDHMTAGTAGAIQVRSVTADGISAAVATDTNVDLATNQTGEFSLSNTNWSPVTHITIPAQQSSISLYYKSTMSGQHSLTATPPAASTWGTGSKTVTVDSAALVGYHFIGSTSAIDAGAATGAITVQASDQYGNPVISTYPQIAYVYSSSKSGTFASSLDGPWNLAAITIQPGSSTAQFYYSNPSPGRDTITVSDTVPLDSPDTGLINASQVVTITSLPPTQLAFTSTSQSAVAGTMSQAIHIKAEQASGAGAVLGDPFVVQLSTSSASGYFYASPTDTTPITSMTIQPGYTEAVVYYRGLIAGTHTITASGQAVTNATQSYTVTANVAKVIAFATASQQVVAGEDSTQIRIRLQDEYGNPTNASANTVIQLKSNASDGMFSTTAGSAWSAITSTTINSGGNDTYVYYKSTTSGSQQLTATSDGFSDGQQSINILPAAAVRMVVNASSIHNLMAGQVSPLLLVQLVDQYGNLATSSSSDVYLYSSQTGDSFSTSSTFQAPTNHITITAGIGQSAFYYKPSAAGTITLSATDEATAGSPDTQITDGQATVTVQTGDPVHIVTTKPTFIAGSPVPITITLTNAYNIPTPAQIDTKLNLLSSSSDHTYSLTDGGAAIDSVTIPAGQQSITVYYRDVVSGALTLRVTDQADAEDVGLTDARIDSDVAPAALQRIHIITVAPNLEIGQPSQALIVQTQDIYGNPVNVDADMPIYLSSSSATGSFSNSYSFTSTASEFMIKAGTSIATAYYKDLTVGSPTITVRDESDLTAGDTGLTDVTQTATIHAGIISKLAWKNLPASLEAGETGSVVIEARNAYDIPVAVDHDTTIYLSHALQDAGFSTTNAGPWTTSSATIPSGSSSVSLYYRSNNSGQDSLVAADSLPLNTDAGWTNANTGIQITAGIPSQLVATSTEQSIIARHPSAPIVIQSQNYFGAPSSATTDTRIYVRSTSSNGEFSAGTGQQWGVNYVTLPANQTDAAALYHDSTVGKPTMTFSDNLPITPDTLLTNTTQPITITPQTVDHLLVTNISTPQSQGSPSSVVVQAQDNANFIVSDYTGTISFSSSDGDTILPSSYTFNPATDDGMHTFTNGVSFLHAGTKTVTATDTKGLTGSQPDILVGENSAGPIATLAFSTPASPYSLNKNSVSSTLTIQSTDSNNQASNAPKGGYPVRITSSSATGQFSLSSNGPWTSTLITKIPEYLSSLNIYYKDSSAGTPTITASDWQGGVDDSGITNATLSVQIKSLLVTLSTDLQINNNRHYYEPYSQIFTKNANGDYYAKAQFTATISDQLTAQATNASTTFTWKDPSGTVLDTKTLKDSNTYVYAVDPIQGHTAAGNYTLEVSAQNDAGITGFATYTIPVTGWTMRVEYDPANHSTGHPLPFTVKTFFNDVPTDAPDFTVVWNDQNGLVPTGTVSEKLQDMKKTGTGVYTGTIATDNLKATTNTESNAYYLYGEVYKDNLIVAEDNHYDIFFQNNPALAPTNFRIEKTLTSTPPADETYNLTFKWNASQYANDYVIYRSQNRDAKLYTDPCSIDDVRAGHRLGDNGATTPFCETQIQQDVGTDDTTQWVEMARVDSTHTSTTIPWATLQTDLPGSTYYYLIRAENGTGQSGYSTMAVSVKKHLTTNTGTSSVNWISIPYYAGDYTNSLTTASKLTKASDIVKDIEGSISGSAGNDKNKKINRIALWDSTIQSTSLSYTYNTVLHKWTGSDFTINPGAGVYIQATEANGFDWTQVGSDTVLPFTFEPNTNTSNINWISLPYTSQYHTASAIARDIEGSTTGAVSHERNIYINRISLWTPANQSTSKSYTYNTALHKWTGSDFTINPGDGVYLQLSGGQVRLNWTPSLTINPYN